MNMKKLLVGFLAMLSAFVYAESKTVFSGEDQRWVITDIKSNEQYTAIYCDVHILSNTAGCIEAHKDDKNASIYLYGSWGQCKLVATEYSGDYKPYSFVKGYLPEMNYYIRGNRGKIVNVIFYFTRIPAGIDAINWFCDGGFALSAAPCKQYHCPKFDAKNIKVDNNPNTTTQTSYTEEKLKEVWENRKCAPMEGVYSFLATTSHVFWGYNRHTLAVIKDEGIYNIVYIKGSNTTVWKEGELKGTLSPTNTKGLYKITSWFIENKMPTTADFYLEHNGNYITLHDAKTGVETQFVKLYPENDLSEEDIDTNTNSSPKKGEDTPSGNGSGFFVSRNVVATNHHVVDGAKKIEVVIQTNESVKTYKAKVLSVDKLNDLALLTIEDKDFVAYDTLPYQIAPRSIEVGSSVFTMGYPMTGTMGAEIKVTDGIISSKTGFQGNVSTYQISAPIQPGNSGGPMFSKEGKLVGITSAGIPGAENVGYAIKSSYLNSFIESAPITIDDISTNQIADKSLPEQIKMLIPYVVLVYIYL